MKFIQQIVQIGLFSFFVSLPNLVNAQSTIKGKVVDDKGAGIPFSNVFLKK